MFTPGALDPVFIYANYAEACLWAGLGTATLMKCRSPAGIVLGITLLAFGLSDVVEVRTGAWYRPWWMLGWKAACVALIAAPGIKLMWLWARKS